MTLAQRARDVDQVQLFRLAPIGIYPFLQSCRLNHNVHRRRMDDFVLRMHRNHFTRAPLDLPYRNNEFSLSNRQNQQQESISSRQRLRGSRSDSRHKPFIRFRRLTLCSTGSF